MPINVYGLTNCDSTRAALKWMKAQGMEAVLHDVKQEGLTEAKLNAWLEKLPLEKLLNKKSTTWRGLPAEQQALAASEKTAVSLMIENTSLVKRPVVEWPDGSLTTGFGEAAFAEKK